MKKEVAFSFDKSNSDFLRLAMEIECEERRLDPTVPITLELPS